MQLGRYRLDEQVGQGGMAVVWRGFDTQLRRVVAVKVLHPHLHSREEIRKRFTREAQAVARLHHPNILDVFDSSDPAAEPSWLVMEFVRGQNLRAFAELHAFDPPELAAACLLPVCDALEHAHQGGVIHRDLKPENVMVRDDGTVKLTDFGIAAIVEPDEKYTATGQILGSPAHLAPEIIEGKPASTASDLFSLGTMLYWLSCGKLPFLAPTPAALLRLIMECRPTDPRMVRPSVSDGLARIIARCLSRDPSVRPASAGELSKELSAALAEAGVERPREELVAFVKGEPPEAVATALRGRLVERAVERGQEALHQKNTAQALAAFSRALALDPQNGAAREEIERIHQRTRRARLIRRGAVGASLVLLAGVAGVQGPAFLRRQGAPGAVGPPLAAGAAGPATPGAGSDQPAPPSNAVAAPANAVAPSGGPGAPGAATAAPAAAAAAPGADGAATSRPDRGSAAPAGSLAPDAGLARPGRADAGPIQAPDDDGAPATEAALPAGPGSVPAGNEPRPQGGRGNQPRRDAPHPPEPAKLYPIAIYIPLPGQLIVDGKDYGVERSFQLSLPAGTHEARINKDEFEPNTMRFDVGPGITEARLKLGAPRDALVTVVGGPPDVPVKIGSALVGTIGDLAARPAAVNMQGKATRDVEITVGSQVFKRRLKAGTRHEIDLGKPAAEPERRHQPDAKAGGA